MGLDGNSLIQDGWFMEKGKLWPGQAMSLQVDKVLHHSNSGLQDVLVFKSKTYGNVLVLDGVIQCTERDEFSYQEMMAHVPMFSHPDPRNVLVVGGGDGGVVREVLKHPSVQAVTLCEIDSRVIEVAKEFLPTMSCSFADTRVTVMKMDGSEYMRQHTGEYDVIITDSSDPIGPAEALFETPYYEAMNIALKPDGILCTQGECMWLHANLIRTLLANCSRQFAVATYGYVTIPTYPSGQIGFIVCSKNKATDFSNPGRGPTEEIARSLKYYSSAIHKAAFVLPEFARRELLS